MPRVDATKGEVVPAPEPGYENIVIVQKAATPGSTTYGAPQDGVDSGRAASNSRWDQIVGSPRPGASTDASTRPDVGAPDAPGSECPDAEVAFCHHPADEAGLRRLGYHHWFIKTGPDEAIGVNGGEKRGMLDQGMVWLPENVTLKRSDVECIDVCGADADRVKEQAQPFATVPGSFWFDNNCYTNAAEVLRNSGATHALPQGPRPERR